MSAGNVVVGTDERDVAIIAANLIGSLLRANPGAVLALPTGRTPLPLYEEIVSRYAAGQIDFGQARGFNLDEWVGVPPDVPGSYAKFMLDYLYRGINLPINQRFIPDGMAADLVAECARYEDLVRQVGGIDLAILGIGGNGHIGFNEPGTSFETRTHVCEVAPETRAANAYSFPSGECPKLAITVGIKTILEAREIILIVTGDAKANPLAAALNGPITEALPASVLRTHPRVQVIADRPAAELLPRIR